MVTTAIATGRPKISLPATSTGLLKVQQTDEVAQKAEELLTRDMERHHVFFNASGFHNHITHFILALHATSAPIPALIQAYRENSAYQLPATKADPEVISALSSASSSSSSLKALNPYLGKGPKYASFLSFFLSELDRLDNDIPKLLNQHLFAQTPRAEDLLVRLHSGFLHPLIHLMYGIEFSLPAVVAQALAQAAVHGDALRDFLLSSERLASSRASSSSAASAKKGGKEKGNAKKPPLSTLYAAVRENEKLATSARFTDDQKITDGVLARAKDEMLDVVSRVKVGEDELEEKMWEMYDCAAFMTFGSAGCQKGKREKVDFFFMHHTNSSPFYISLLSLASISASTKARLLEWKIRLDLLQYAARGAPELSLGFLSGTTASTTNTTAVSSPSTTTTTSSPLSSSSSSSTPSPSPPPATATKTTTVTTTTTITTTTTTETTTTTAIKPSQAFRALHLLKDDGHAIKLARSLEILRVLGYHHRDDDDSDISSQQQSKSGGGSNPVLSERGHFKDKDVWEKLFAMMVESTGREGEAKWVRSAGMIEAWKDIPDKHDGK